MPRPVRVGSIALVLAALFLATGWPFLSPASNAISETSAVTVAPDATATFVSELGPAVMVPPRQPQELPSSGSAAAQAGSPWSNAAGAGLAVSGALLIYAALILRPRNNA